MNEIKIALSIPGLPEAINHLAEVICNGSVPIAATLSESEAVDATQPVVAAIGGVPQVPVAPAQSIQHSAAEANDVSDTAAEPVSYTIEQLSVAGAALCEQGKMAQLIALLGKYGVQAVTQLKPTPDVLNAFAGELKALGANL